MLEPKMLMQRILTTPSSQVYTLDSMFWRQLLDTQQTAFSKATRAITTKLESKYFSNIMRITLEAWGMHSQSTNQSDDWLRSNWKLHESRLQGTPRIVRNWEGTARAYLRAEWWEFGISLIRRIRTCPYSCIRSPRMDQFWHDTFGTV